MQDLSPDALDARLRAAPVPPVPPELRQRLAARILAAQRMATRSASQAAPGGPDSLRKDYPPMAAQHTPRRTNPLPAVAGAFVVIFALLALLIFHNAPRTSGIGVARAHTPTAVVTATATTSGQPRAAYLGADNHLHFVTAQGQDAIGPALPDPNVAGYLKQEIPSILTGVSADGRYLAYLDVNQSNGTGEVVIFDMTKQTFAQVSIPAEPDNLLFAPSGSLLIVNDTLQTSTPDDATKMFVVDAAKQTVTTTTFQTNQTELRLLGWGDASHVITLMEPAPSTGKAFTVLKPNGGFGGPLIVSAVDVMTGATRNISTIANLPPDVFLSPDGSSVLNAPNYGHADGSLIDVTTGATKALPQISSALTGAFQQFENASLAQAGNWAIHYTGQPSSDILALSLSGASIPNEGLYRGTTPPAITQDAGVWLLDLAHDQATRMDHGQYPLAWTANGASLFVCNAPTQTDYNSGFVIGPTLSVLSPVTPSSTLKTLTTSMQAFFGLVQ